MKKLFIMLLSLCLVFSACFAFGCTSKDYEEGPQGLKLTLINNGTEYEVSKGACVDAEIVIPSTYKDKPITSIGEYAFDDYETLTSIRIPEKVTRIGQGAFYCGSLNSVVFEDISTWYYTSNDDYTGGETVSVANPTVNASKLKDENFHYYWYKQ